ncbi:hypothetical protein [Lacrimispora sp.]|uniref:hypothetical protein n=1 Tax=Lacrimispora sp. TaxID=2719234 RepID=UPI0028AEB439|nr:hypothetical protein [Lacrimispora sp.]
MNGLDGYKMVGTFVCGDILMVIIEAIHGTHVMTSDEWEKKLRMGTDSYRSAVLSKRE